MTSAITVVEGKKIVTVQQKLLVGFHLHGTIAQISSFRPAVLKPRPYLPYLMHTLYRLGCDVHFITSLNPVSDADGLRSFFHHHVGIPHHIHYELPSDTANASTSFHQQARLGSGGGSTGSLGQKASAPLTRQSFMPLLQRRAKEIQTTPDNILFVDAEVNYRFSPVQTIVMEKFVHYTNRDKRKAYREYVGREIDFQSPASETSGSRGNRVVARHEEHRQRLARQTAFLMEEQHQSDVSSASKKNEPTLNLSPEERIVREMASGGKDDSNDLNEVSPAKPRREGLIAYHKPLPSALLQDYTCVALATLLIELAASPSPCTVKEFLRREPILEQLRVPMHEVCYYLAKDNCEDMELVDWEEVEVQEAKAEERRRAEVGPIVKENEAHSSFFQ